VRQAIYAQGNFLQCAAGSAKPADIMHSNTMTAATGRPRFAALPRLAAVAALATLCFGLAAVGPNVAAAEDGGDAAPDTAPAASLVATPAIGERVRVELATGDVLLGTLEARDADSVVVAHPLLGSVPLPAADVVSVLGVPADMSGADAVAAGVATGAGDAVADAAEATGDAAVDGAAVADAGAQATTDAAEAEPETAWSGEVSAGADGSQGNNDRFSARAALIVQRESSRNISKLDAQYKRAEENSNKTDDVAIVQLRNDWRLAEESRWALFVDGLFEYDAFKDYDYRTALNVGPAYRFYDTEDLKLSGRLGVGASREFGSDDTDVKPELLVGLDYQHQLTETQKVVAGVQVYPDLSELGEFRAIARLAYDMTMIERLGLSLRLGLEDRYDSNVEADTEENDFDYFIALVRGF
jgi:putative salt-induced outer membrane protein YdiY